MLKTVLKLAVFLFLRTKIKNTQTDTSQHLSTVKNNIVLMAELRAALFKRNFIDELGRLGNSVIGFMFMLLAAFCSGLIGLMWLFALAWTSPERNIILSIALILPLVIGISIYAYIRNSWKKEHLFDKTMTQIENDWRIFRSNVKNATENITD